MPEVNTDLAMNVSVKKSFRVIEKNAVKQGLTVQGGLSSICYALNTGIAVISVLSETLVSTHLVDV